MKDNQGKSILNLVITIAISLIIGGIAIAMITGDNGLLVEKQDAVTEEAENKVKEEINTILLSIQEEARKKITDNPEVNLIKEYKQIDLTKYGVRESEGYSVTKNQTTIEENKVEESAISNDGIIEIKYNNKKLGITVSGTIDFKIKGNESDQGSTYGIITKAQ